VVEQSNETNRKPRLRVVGGQEPFFRTTADWHSIASEPVNFEPALNPLECVTPLSDTTCFRTPRISACRPRASNLDDDISTTRSPIATKLENRDAEIVENKIESSKKY
jgi:hypothetical protein